jgi:GH15 family glucan-1,4-alpha-glucosidase
VGGSGIRRLASSECHRGRPTPRPHRSLLEAVAAATPLPRAAPRPRTAGVHWSCTEWLCAQECNSSLPLQVLYGIHGETSPKQTVARGVPGYRGSAPVRLGNHAYKQVQLDAFGFLADCSWSYLRCGGNWEDRFWVLVQRCADYVWAHWQQPGNRIWELPCCQHYLSSRVMSWVMLDRALKIASEVAPRFDTAEWTKTRTAKAREIMARGWSERLGSFRQRYETENLDAAALLIPVFEFLPADHPQVQSTVDRIAEELTTRTCSFLGNTPLLFSHVEYIRAQLELDASAGRGRGRAPRA